MNRYHRVPGLGKTCVYVRWVSVVTLLIVAAGFASGCGQQQAQPQAQQQSQGQQPGKQGPGGRRGGGGGPAVPVMVDKVTLKTIPVEVSAIGNVEAYSTVSVKAQVAGPLL